MKRLEGYIAGANFGGWISQFGKISHEHFKSFIKESDVERLASWGMDHVRLPVDYFVFEDDENPGIYKEEGLVYIDNCLNWCKKYNLNLILDLHHAPGFFFGKLNENNLFTDKKMQQRFIEIWVNFAKRYAAEGDNLIFELLNELVWENSIPWNSLWKRTVSEIKKISPKRKIIIGGNHYNSANELENINISEDENVIYTFHMYEPFIFTHQAASWNEAARNYKKQVEYPFNVSEHEEFFKINGKSDYFKTHEIIDINFLYDFLKPVITFKEKNIDKILYCGEYGAIENAPLKSIIRWHNDITDIFLQYGIGRAVWSYKEMNFPVTKSDGSITSEELIKILSRK
ncbi:MAG: hypothetical protein K0S55_1123 [Clostridia bacterium]|nr:hypothetical protein [Clostridia bacterium]